MPDMPINRRFAVDCGDGGFAVLVYVPSAKDCDDAYTKVGAALADADGWGRGDSMPDEKAYRRVVAELQPADHFAAQWGQGPEVAQVEMSPGVWDVLVWVSAPDWHAAFTVARSVIARAQDHRENVFRRLARAGKAVSDAA